MVNASSASFRGCVATFVLASGFLLTLDAQQPPASAPPAPAVRDLLALDVDVASLLPADEASYGFDNVTVGDLSPTLLDRYIAAAEKISRVAVGRPSVSPDGDTIRTPADLTQEDHIEGLPIGTRGGALVSYTFPMDGDYEFQIRLTRDRNEHVEGLNDAAELELLLDRERVKLFNGN